MVFPCGSRTVRFGITHTCAFMRKSIAREGLDVHGEDTGFLMRAPWFFLLGAAPFVFKGAGFFPRGEENTALLWGEEGLLEGGSVDLQKFVERETHLMGVEIFVD